MYAMMEAHPDTILELSISIWLGIAFSQKPRTSWFYPQAGDTLQPAPHY